MNKLSLINLLIVLFITAIGPSLAQAGSASTQGNENHRPDKYKRAESDQSAFGGNLVADAFKVAAEQRFKDFNCTSPENGASLTYDLILKHVNRFCGITPEDQEDKERGFFKVRDIGQDISTNREYEERLNGSSTVIQTLKVELNNGSADCRNTNSTRLVNSTKCVNNFRRALRGCSLKVDDGCVVYDMNIKPGQSKPPSPTLAASPIPSDQSGSRVLAPPSNGLLAPLPSNT